MKEKAYNRSFATRLSRWVILVLLIMIGGLSLLLYYFNKSALIEVSANNFHVGLRSTDRAINNVMSGVDVAVRNNLPDIEHHLKEPDQMQAIVERIVTQNPRIRSCGISFIDNYYPQKGRWFCPYAWRNDSMQVETQQLGGSSYDYQSAQWFKDAIARDSAFWSEPFFDGQDAKTPLVAYMHPVHDAQGRLVAIVGADLSLDFMTQILQGQDSILEKESWTITGKLQSYVLSRNGTFITHPDHRRIQKGNFFGHVKDADEPGVAEKIVNEIKERKTSTDETTNLVKVNRKESYVFYSPITDTDWMLVITIRKFGLDMFGAAVGIFILLINIVVLMVTFLVCFLTIKRTAKPLKLLADAADKVAQGKFDTPLPTIKQRDEICQLRDSFENMQHSLTEYIEDLKTTTSEKASIENELKIAHSIQMSMLPKTYPAFPNRTDIDIFGEVTPAKAVGGDLYDFFVRDEKLFFCIGDVSGKGVPASLVMAVTRTLFRRSTHMTGPSRIMETMNEAISEGNDNNMFVTLFIGVLDLQTGHLRYCNAGHNAPFIQGTLLPCDSNLPIGVMPDWNFTEQETDIAPDSIILLYTDGLTEAENALHEQFGEQRITDITTSFRGSPRELIETMTDTVHLFVGDTEQSDDLTMLAIKYNK